MDSDEDEKQTKLALQATSDALERIGVDDILGKRVSIEIRNLVVAPVPRVHFQVGDVDSLTRVIEKNVEQVKAIVWNEEEITIDIDAAGREIVFRPEIRDNAAMFFTRENKKGPSGYGSDEPDGRIWEGDYEPVHFTKKSMLTFLKTYGTMMPTELVDSIKNLKVTKSETSEEIMLDENTESVRKIEEMLENTNIPAKFRMMVPITDWFEGELEFECNLATVKDRYSNDRGKKYIQLRCTNARKVLADMMHGILAQLPSDIPRFYGRMHTLSSDRRHL